MVKREYRCAREDCATDGEKATPPRAIYNLVHVEGAVALEEPLMPVVSYYSQKEPAGEAVIWRFMDLRKFRDLMASEELYFRRADLFEDETEGLPPEQYVQRVLGLNPWTSTTA
jgi:hypothetical protein